nr:MAG TPA: hypothetical protein [Caudoviricetes sp.]
MQAKACMTQEDCFSSDFCIFSLNLGIVIRENSLNLLIIPLFTNII